jgi:hypothetical protein
MEYVTPFLVLLAALAWPIVVLIFIRTFRKQIGALIDAIKTLKIFGNEVNMGDRQTPETGKQLGREVKELREGKIEPTIGRTRVLYDPTPVKPIPDAATAPPVTAPASPLQKQIAESILKDPVMKGMDCEEKLKTVVHVQAAYQMHLLFERTFRVIFGSQIDALDLADDPAGLTLNSLEIMFNSAKSQFYAIHKDRTFTQWGNFVLSVGLAEEFNNSGVQRARTTELGREFLTYIRERGYPRPIG